MMDKEQLRNMSDADIIIRYPNHFGLLREYREKPPYVYARIKEAGSGEELWRRRCKNPDYDNRTLDCPAEMFETMEDFIHSGL